VYQNGKKELKTKISDIFAYKYPFHNKDPFCYISLQTTHGNIEFPFWYFFRSKYTKLLEMNLLEEILKQNPKVLSP